MNFQTVSTAEKLPTSDGLAGGYTADGTPGPAAVACAGLHRRPGRPRCESDDRRRRAGRQHHDHPVGQARTGPDRPGARLRRVDDGAIIDAINAALGRHAPRCRAAGHASPSTTTAMLLWLSDRSPAALAFAKHYLLTHTAPANTITDPKGVYSATVTASGLTTVTPGSAADALFRRRRATPHAPDLVGIAQPGVVYTGGVKKIAEHGGDRADDRNVALVVSGAGVHHVSTDSTTGADHPDRADHPDAARAQSATPCRPCSTEHTHTLPLH